MQRKNYILNKRNSLHRSGFAMIMAIIAIVIISTIMAFSLSLTTQTAKTTTDTYLYEQAVLYSKSAAELALLEIAKTNIAEDGCLNSFETDFPDELGKESLFQAKVTMKYVYSAEVTGCDKYFIITTPEQNGTVLMDITITTKDEVATEPIRYFRRSIQKL
ncbi:MAG: hypothetical protein PHS42_06700 [Sulfurimonas sp.]|nr:hypothetical protein [Sulfurimonas sp.]